MVGSVPELYGGRSGSILRKAQFFKEHAGVDSEIVMTHFPGDLQRLTTVLRDRGALVPGVTLGTLQDDQDGDRRPRSPLDRLLETRRRVHARLDRIVGDDKVFFSVEARNIDHLLLSYRNPNVEQVYVVHNPHLEPPYRDPQRIWRPYRPLMLHHASAGAVVFLTRAQRADVERVLGQQDHFVVIPHPVPQAPPVEGVERDPRLVVVLARLDHQKRVEDAITTFARVVQHVPDARMEIYGHGRDEEALQRQIDALRVGSSVTLAGYTDNPGGVYQRAALSLLTSRHEGLPLVLLESLSHGCPPVSYDVRYGPSDVIDHGVNGILVDEGDTSTMAEEVTRLLRDHALRDRMSRAAISSAEGMQADVAVARWSALFNRLAAAAWGSA